jgi:hypothetical protein
VQRHIDIGRVISKVFETYGKYAGVLIPVAAVLFLIELLLNLGAINSTGVAIIASIASLVLSTLYTGTVVELVNDVRDGRLDQSIGGLFRSVTRCSSP